MAEKGSGNLLRVIPSVDRILADPALSALRETYSEEFVKRSVRGALDELRGKIRSGKASKEDCLTQAVVSRASEIAMSRFAPKLKMVINATGVIVHTNLGRSPLSRRVVDRIAEIALS